MPTNTLPIVELQVKHTVALEQVKQLVLHFVQFLTDYSKYPGKQGQVLLTRVLPDPVGQLTQFVVLIEQLPHE